MEINHRLSKLYCYRTWCYCQTCWISTLSPAFCRTAFCESEANCLQLGFQEIPIPGKIIEQFPPSVRLIQEAGLKTLPFHRYPYFYLTWGFGWRLFSKKSAQERASIFWVRPWRLTAGHWKMSVGRQAFPSWDIEVNFQGRTVKLPGSKVFLEVYVLVTLHFGDWQRAWGLLWIWRIRPGTFPGETSSQKLSGWHGL